MVKAELHRALTNFRCEVGRDRTEAGVPLWQSANDDDWLERSKGPWAGVCGVGGCGAGRRRLRWRQLQFRGELVRRRH